MRHVAEGRRADNSVGLKMRAAWFILFISNAVNSSSRRSKNSTTFCFHRQRIALCIFRRNTFVRKKSTTKNYYQFMYSLCFNVCHCWFVLLLWLRKSEKHDNNACTCELLKISQNFFNMYKVVDDCATSEPERVTVRLPTDAQMAEGLERGFAWVPLSSHLCDPLTISPSFPLRPFPFCRSNAPLALRPLSRPNDALVLRLRGSSLSGRRPSNLILSRSFVDGAPNSHYLHPPKS